MVKLAIGGPIEWAVEARTIAYPVEENADLDEAYLSRARPLVDRQLAAAGIRFAAILEDALGQ